MFTVTIVRQPSTDSGTFGQLSIEGNNFTCVSLELPWLNDLPDISCIPIGSYQCTWRWSNAHNRNIYHVENVLNRTAVEIHSANIIAQLLGCICLGTEMAVFPMGTFPGIEVATKGVQHSQQAVAEFEQIMNQQPFNLVISNE